MHLSRRRLAELASPEVRVGFEKGTQLFPDLSVSWEEAIDVRHSSTRDDSLDAAGMLDQFGIITEFKATASTGKPTQPAAIPRDIRKLGLFAEAHATKGTNPLATYLIILDNHRRDDGTASSRYRPDRMSRLLGGVAEKWSESAPKPQLCWWAARTGWTATRSLEPNGEGPSPTLSR